MKKSNECETNNIITELKCGCPEHKIEFNYWEAKDDRKFLGLSILIYQLYCDSSKYHRKLKKPKMIGDVVLLDNEIPKLIKYMKKVEKRFNR